MIDRADFVSLIDRAAVRIKEASGWRRWLIAFLAGASSALAMAPVYLLPLLLVGFTTLILLLDGAGAAHRPGRSAFAAGWFFGFGYFLAGLYWMAFSFFVQADQFAWMAPFAVTGMPAFLGLFTGAAAWVSRLLWQDGVRRILWFAAVWAAVEYVRGHILTGLPWNLTGQALAGAAISAQTAAWYGAYGISLVAIVLAAAPAARLGYGLPPRKVLSGFAAALAGLGVLYAVGAMRLAAPAPVTDSENILRVVQPNIAQRDKINPDKWAENFNRQLDLSKGGVPGAERIFIIWPENGAPLLNEAPTALRVLGDELPQNAVLIAGAVRREPGAAGEMNYYNSIVAAAQTPQGRQVTDAYDKHHLVPFGEYLPFYEALKKLGLAQLTPYGDSGFAAGKGPAVMSVGGPSFAPLICYEVIFPGALYPNGERPDWLLTVTNDAWFGDTSGPRQHLDQARLRTIETGLPMARSANTGISAVIDAKGRILARVGLYQRGRIETALPAALPPTLYHRVGDWPFFVLLVLCAGLSRRWKWGR